MTNNPWIEGIKNRANSADWQPMNTAPLTAQWVDVKMADGEVLYAHWACNLSGEEQPPFKGWFVESSSGRYTEIDEPTAWREHAQD